MTPEQLHNNRRAALATLARLIEVHPLPAPLTVYASETCLDIRLDDENRAGVAAWANVLGLHDGDDIDCGPFTSVSTARWTESGTWGGFQHVRVWSACDRKPI